MHYSSKSDFFGLESHRVTGPTVPQTKRAESGLVRLCAQALSRCQGRCTVPFAFAMGLRFCCVAVDKLSVCPYAYVAWFSSS